MQARKDMTKTTKWSKRTMVRLNADELQQLKEYVDSDQAAYANIKMNSGISYETINSVIKRGTTELHVAIRLRDFLKALKLHQA